MPKHERSLQKAFFNMHIQCHHSTMQSSHHHNPHHPLHPVPRRRSLNPRYPWCLIPTFPTTLLRSQLYDAFRRRLAHSWCIVSSMMSVLVFAFMPRSWCVWRSSSVLLLATTREQKMSYKTEDKGNRYADADSDFGSCGKIVCLRSGERG